MAEVERIYNVPLGRVKDVPRSKRAPYAMRQLRNFVIKHMKVDEDKIKINAPLNEAVWARGIRKPPRKIRVKAIKTEDGVEADVVGG